MKLKLCSIAIMILTTTYSLSSYANDWKGYHGTSCKADSTRDARYSLAGITNWELADINVFCPIVRDVQTGGSDRVAVNVSLRNNSNTAGGFCRLFSRNFTNTGTIELDTFAWPAGIANVTATLGPVDSSDFGNYLVACRIPGADGNNKSILRSLRVEEIF